jgi:hypothetical protein
MMCGVSVVAAAQPTTRSDDSQRKRTDASVAVSTVKPTQAAATKTLREVAQEIAARHGIRIVIDDSVRADVRAPAVPEGVLRGSLLEATLRALFSGNELMFHYGADGPKEAERLKAVWVFARAQGPALYVTDVPTSGCSVAAVESSDAEERAAALHRLSSEPPVSAGPILNRALQDADENVRLQALQAGLTNTAGPDVDTLKRLIEEDASEAVRTLALQAFVAHPGASEDEVRSMLDRVADDSQRMLAELARSLREARFAAPTDTSLTPEPVNER